jgi:hypothetical protein
MEGGRRGEDMRGKSMDEDMKMKKYSEARVARASPMDKAGGEGPSWPKKLEDFPGLWKVDSF